MYIKKTDINILRKLAKLKAEFAADSVNSKRELLWTNLNDLKMEKPAIFINEIPWHEMNFEDELTLQCEDTYCRSLEQSLRQEIYSWKHMQGDMIVSPYISSPLVIHDTGFGISENVDTLTTDDTSGIVSRHFNIQIQNEQDICKIKNPVISLDKANTEANYNLLQEIFDGIIEVKKVGVKGEWFTPWDNLIRLTGIEQAMFDLVERPEYVNKLVERFVDASIVRLNKYSELGLWGSNNDNTRVGSGGYGYSNALLPADTLLNNAPLKQLWGCGNAQIFSEVSPKMHWEFSLKHEIRYLSHFGLSYYGCCEPLHNKLDILAKIPNLRKISMSPWAKLDVANDIVKGKYVLSCKPNPAIFALDSWEPSQVRREIVDIIEKTRDCSIEIIMKDISTVKYQPQRLWEWATIARDTIDSYFGY